MAKYLVGVCRGFDHGGSPKLSVNACLFDVDYFPTSSGVEYFIVEAMDKEQAEQIGKDNYLKFREEIAEVYEKQGKEKAQVYRKYKLLGYHQEDQNG